MITIDTIDDLVRVLRETPDWAEAVRSVLLSKELLNLPKHVATLAASITDQTEITNRRLHNLEHGQTQLLNSLKSVRGELANIAGSDYQRQAAGYLLRVGRGQFGLQGTRLTHQADTTNGELRRLINQAADDTENTFTDDDAESVELADAAAVGTAPDGTPTHLLAERSLTVQPADVTRARDRATLRARATGTTCHAVVIGDAITTGAQALADANEVNFAHFPSRRPPAP